MIEIKWSAAKRTTILGENCAYDNNISDILTR
jgi:hypothetical protein